MPLLFLLCILLAGEARGSEWLARDFDRILSPRHAATAGIGLGLAVLAHTWDGEVEKKLQGKEPFSTTADYSNIYGSSYFNLPTSLGIWGVGVFGRYPSLERTGATLLRTMAWTQAVVGPIKLAARRRRPDGSNRLSFPSGHTANAFAIARLMQREHGQRVGIPLYALSVLVAAGRIEDNRHYFSDVVMGAFLGTIVGNAVSLEGNARQFAVRPHWIEGRPALKLRLAF